MQVLLYFFILLFCTTANAQKNYTIKECEQLFETENLNLITAYYNIDIAKAKTLQAGIWEQPYLSGELNIYTPQSNQIFNVGQNGQKAYTVQQIIYLGNKKKKEKNYTLAQQNNTELEYKELLQSLKKELYDNFYSLYFNLLKLQNLESQISQIDSLLITYNEQETKGNIPLKDVVRLQSLLYEFKNDKNQLLKQCIDEQSVLKIITNSTEEIQPFITKEEIEVKLKPSKIISKEELFEIAKSKNIQYLEKLQEIKIQENAYKWQKSLVQPDLNLGGAYDQRGGAFLNQYNLFVGIPLPIWNKNKGNVRAAKYELEQSKMREKQYAKELELNLDNSFQKLKLALNQNNDIEKGNINTELVLKGMLQNFYRRNITMLEFTDFMESYTQNMLFRLDTQKDIFLNGNQINFICNDSIF